MERVFEIIEEQLHLTGVEITEDIAEGLQEVAIANAKIEKGLNKVSEKYKDWNKVLTIILEPARPASIAMCLSNIFLSRTYPFSGRIVSSSTRRVPLGATITPPLIL